MLLGPRRYAIPWLLAPDNAFHAMPTLPLANIGSMRVELTAASTGFRSGSGAIYGKVIYRF